MKIKRTILSIIMIGIVIYVISTPKISEYIDDVVLLEKRHPGYYDCLSNASLYFVSKDVLEEPNANLLTNIMRTKDISDEGLQIQVDEDGSFTISGTYSGENPIYIYPFEIGNLKSGNYILSDGGASIENKIQMRIFGLRDSFDGNREYGNYVQLPGEGLLHWDKDEYDRACIDVKIYPGFSAEKLRFCPMLSVVESSGLSYQNALRKLTSLSADQNPDDYVIYMETKLDKKSLNWLEMADWQILCNEAKYQKNASWICVDYGDGTGIQIIDDNLDEAIYGEIDTVGRVRNKLDD